MFLRLGDHRLWRVEWRSSTIIGVACVEVGEVGVVMPSGGASPDGSGLVARVRAWWDESSFLGDVALLFTIVTVGNSVMMLTGLDEPKIGSFAYLHLLGRLGIITVVVGVFYLGEFGTRLTRWWNRTRQAGHLNRARPSPRTVLNAALGFFLGRWLEGTARVFTAVVVTVCVVVFALAGVRPPAGGPGLYRDLVLLAVVVLAVMLPATRWWQYRMRARVAPSA